MTWLLIAIGIFFALEIALRLLERWRKRPLLVPYSEINRYRISPDFRSHNVNR